MAFNGVLVRSFLSETRQRGQAQGWWSSLGMSAASLRCICNCVCDLVAMTQGESHHLLNRPHQPKRVAEYPAFAAIRRRVLGTSSPRQAPLVDTDCWVPPGNKFQLSARSRSRVTLVTRVLIPKGEGIRVRKRTGRVQFSVLLRLWTGPPQNNNNNK